MVIHYKDSSPPGTAINRVLEQKNPGSLLASGIFYRGKGLKAAAKAATGTAHALLELFFLLLLVFAIGLELVFGEDGLQGLVIGLSILIIFCTIAIILPHKVVEMVAIKEV